MNIITIDVENIGQFEIKQSLTIMEDSQLENRIDELLNGKYYELKARAEKLAESHPEIAKQIFTQVYVIEIIATLEKLIVSYPGNLKSIHDITEYNQLFQIWGTYKKKIAPPEKKKKDSKS